MSEAIFRGGDGSESGVHDNFKPADIEAFLTHGQTETLVMLEEIGEGLDLVERIKKLTNNPSDVAQLAADIGRRDLDESVREELKELLHQRTLLLAFERGDYLPIITHLGQQKSVVRLTESTDAAAPTYDKNFFDHAVATLQQLMIKRN